MIVGADGGALSVADPRLQVGVYKVNLRLLQKITQSVDSIYYRIYIFTEVGEGVRKSVPKGEFRKLHPMRGWQYIAIPLELYRNPPNVFLGLSQSLPRFLYTSHIDKRRIILPSLNKQKIKQIGIIYDLGFLHYPEFYPGSAGQLLRNTTHLVRNSDHIITISQSVKNDILKHFKFPKNKITVAYPGSDFLGLSPRKFRKKSKPYFLYIGALKRSKNVPTVLKAFFRYRQTFPDTELIIAGGDYWRDPDIDRTLKNVSDTSRIRFLGHVPDSTLPDLYVNAIALLSPSFWEGFGLQIVEAMSLGVPVIVSNRGSLPEITDGVGMIVDPLDFEAMAHEMVHLTDSPAYRRTLSDRSLKRAQLFTWDKFAETVREVITNYESKT